MPVLFNLVVVENFAGCQPYAQATFAQSRQKLGHSPQLSYVLEGLSSYAQKETRKYIHLVDGGITDNLGLLAIYEMVEVAGGAKPLLDYIGSKPAPRFIIISVNASTTPQYNLEATNMTPSMETVVNSVTDIQLHRGNASTMGLVQEGIERWKGEFEGLEQPIETYFVEVNFKGVAQANRRFFFNQMPTNYSLRKEQLDDLIDVGAELLENSPEFRRLLQDLATVDHEQAPD